MERLIKVGKLLTSCFHSNTILLVPAVFPIRVGTTQSFVGKLHTIELDKMSQSCSCKCTELTAAHDLGAMLYCKTLGYKLVITGFVGALK